MNKILFRYISPTIDIEEIFRISPARPSLYEKRYCVKSTFTYVTKHTKRNGRLDR
jgi:hypothetical protein